METRNRQIQIFNCPSIFFQKKSPRVEIKSTSRETGPHDTTYYYHVFIDGVEYPMLSWVGYSGWGHGSNAMYFHYNEELFLKLKEIYGESVNIW